MQSLEDLCLDTIINNFNTFNLAYHTSKNVKLNLLLEFLQRRYSLDLATKLEDFKQDYLDFVINKFLKRLDTSWMENISWDAIAKKVSEVGPNLEKFFCFDEAQPWESVICHLTKLKVFQYEFYCKDIILCNLVKFCPLLEHIFVKGSRDVSNDGIKYLCQTRRGKTPCPNLKFLYIEDTSVDDDGIKYLIQNLSPSLKYIDYRRLPEVIYSIHKNNINNLGSMKPYNIISLNLCKIPTSLSLTVKSDIIKICLTLCPHLLYLKLPVFTQEHLDLCLQLSKLEHLSLDCLTEPPLAINDFLKLKGNMLRLLNLKKFSVSVSTLIQSCPQLTFLKMDNITYESNDSESLSLLLNWKRVSFKNLNMTDCVTAQAVIRLLSSSSNLNELSLRHCNKGSETFPFDVKSQILKCCEQCKLLIIDFSYSAADIEFIKNVLLKCFSLDILYLNGFDPSAIEELKRVSSTLRNNPLRDCL